MAKMMVDREEVDAYLQATGIRETLTFLLSKIIRERPGEPLEVVRDYCVEVLNARKAEAAAVVNATLQVTQELVLQLFLDADEDKNGYLDPREFKKVLQRSELGLSKTEIRGVLEDADSNADGYIEYREFLPMMMDLLAAAEAKAKAAHLQAEAQMQATAYAYEYLVHGMTQDELKKMIESVFKNADKDGNGHLDKKEFKLCLKESGLGLTKKEINHLMAFADVDGNGTIDLEEFAPLCFEILVTRVRDDMLAGASVANAGELETMLLDGLVAAETAFRGDAAKVVGKLSRKHVTTVLQDVSYNAGLGLSQVQLLTVMGQCNADGQGNVDYRWFVAVAGKMIHSMVDAGALKRRMLAGHALADTDQVFSLRGLDKETCQSIFEQAFAKADADRNGYIEKRELWSLLEDLAVEDLPLTMEEMEAVEAAMDADGDGRISYMEFMDAMWGALMHIQRADTADYFRGLDKDTVVCILEGALFEADENGNGRIEAHEVMDVLEALSYQEDLPLTMDEMNQIEVALVNDGQSSFPFKDAVEIMWGVLINSQREAEKAPKLRGLDKETVTAILEMAFQRADVDNSGTLEAHEVWSALEDLAVDELPMTMDEIEALYESLVGDGTRSVSYQEFLGTMWKVLINCQRKVFESAAPSLRGITRDNFFDIMTQAFHDADVDQSGTLDMAELWSLLEDLAAGPVPMTMFEMEALMAMFDDNKDGSIDYMEYMDGMWNLLISVNREDYVQNHVLREEEEEYMDVGTSLADEILASSDQMQLLRGLDHDTVEVIFSIAFDKADRDGNGFLDEYELGVMIDELSRDDLPMTQDEVDALRAGFESIADDDGFVTKEAFFEIMWMCLMDSQQNGVTIRGMDQMTVCSVLEEALIMADANGNFVVESNEVFGVLEELQANEILPLTMSEIEAIEAALVQATQPPGPSGLPFSMAVELMWDVLKGIAVQNGPTMRGLDRDTVMAILEEAFVRADADKSGTLEKDEVFSVLEDLAREELPLTMGEIEAIEKALVGDGTRHVSYNEFLGTMFSVLLRHQAAESQRNAGSRPNLAKGRLNKAMLRGLDRATANIIMQEAFAKADKDGNGTLDKEEVIALMDDLAADELPLTQQELDILRDNLDADGDGLVDYNEFCNAMWAALVEDKVEEPKLRGLDGDTIISILMSALEAGDANKSGTLEKEEVHGVLDALCKNEELPLTMQEIEAVEAALNRAPTKGVPFEAAAQMMWGVLQDFAVAAPPEVRGLDEETTKAIFQKAFEEADKENKGHLSAEEVEHVLEALALEDLPMTMKEIDAISRAIIENGGCQYPHFIGTCWSVLAARNGITV